MQIPDSLNIKSFIHELVSMGIRINLSNGELKMLIKKDFDPDPEIVNKIRINKEEIIKYLTFHERPSTLKHFSKSPNAQLPLSFGQESLWLIDKLLGSINYHINAVFRIEGNLNESALSSALEMIIDRHDILKTVIRDVEGVPFQQVMPFQNFNLECTEVGYSFNSGDGHHHLRSLINRPFDLAKDLMLRVGIIHFSENFSCLWFAMHHIVSDGWSLPLLINEIKVCYNAIITGSRPDLPELTRSYTDFALWQRESDKNGLIDNQLEYWKTKLEDVPSYKLPADFYKSRMRSGYGQNKLFFIEQNIVARLRSLSRENEVTLFTCLIGIFKILLYKYSGEQDICIGTVSANREFRELEPLIGFFANTLTLRSQINPAVTLCDFVKETRRTVLEAYTHQDVPFEKVVNSLSLERVPDVNPLFQIMFSFQENGSQIASLMLKDAALTPLIFDPGTSKFDISFNINSTQQGLNLDISFDDEIFRPETIDRLYFHYLKLIQDFIKNPHRVIKEISLFDEKDRELISAINRTAEVSQGEETLLDLFRAQVELRGEETAVVFEDSSLTYRELDARSNQLAHYLVRRGVKPGSLVPVCVERSLEMIIGLLGILKSGGAYVPIDPDYPSDRIRYILEDTSAELLLSSGELLGAVSGHRELVLMDRDGSQISKEATTGPGIKIAPGSLAYVIYTSGSTGRPKGVMVEHLSLANRLIWSQDYFNLTTDDVILQKTTFSFDVSVWELFWPLMAGAKLVFAIPGGHGDPKYLKSVIQSEKITTIHFVPSMFEAFLNSAAEGDCKTLKRVLCSGEALKAHQVTLFREKFKALPLFNLYGPTEATVDVSCWDVKGDIKAFPNLPIGKPITNTVIYIVDREMNLVPVGIPGELYIGGVQVSRGYLNRGELTMERFVANPYGPGRLYRTGDLGRWLPDGNIEYLGRMDDQVKIRGYRIELGEIESVLVQHAGISEALVVAREQSSGDKYLAAYYVSSDGRELDSRELKEYLGGQLPGYMVPSAYVWQEQFRLTANGKIDKKSLPEPEVTGSLTGGRYVAPRNEIEERLAEIWQEVLGLERVGVDDAFFEVGGNSLKAVALISRMDKEFGANMHLKDLFTNSSIRSLCNLLQKQESEYANHIRQCPVSTDYPLSSGQLRIWLLSQMDGGNKAYNVCSVYRINGDVNQNVLECAFLSLIGRHEILRTNFKQSSSGIARQFIRPDNSSKFTLDVEELEINYFKNSILDNKISNEINYDFDLENDILIRIKLIKLGNNEHILICVLHHIICDAWSLELLMKEMVENYEYLVIKKNVENPPLRIQYKDYAVWQQENLNAGGLTESRNYWLEQFKVRPGTLDLPVSRSRPLVKTYNGKTIKRKWNRRLVAKLKTLKESQQLTMFMLLLSGLKVLLYKYSDQEDIVIGSPISERLHSDLSEQLGFFLNSLAFRTRLDPNESFITLLSRVKNIAINAYEHQKYPFDKIIEDLNLADDISRSPLFDVMFVYLDTSPDQYLTAVRNLQIGSLDISELGSTSKVDLTFTIREFDNEIEASLEFNTDLFTGEIASQLLDHFEQILKSLTDDPLVKISETNYLTEKDYSLIHSFNDTGKPYDLQISIIDLFENALNLHSGQTAIVCGDQLIQYHELNMIANKLCNHLQRNYKIEPGTPVGVLIEPSAWSVIALLSILKLGCVYVPLDSSIPADRLNYIIRDSQIQLLLHIENGIIASNNLNYLDPINIADLALEHENSDRPKIEFQNELIAYLIYTSGSTGKPKGVRQTYLTLYNLIKWNTSDWETLPEPIYLQFSSFGFDMSIYDILYTLVSGGQLHVAKKEYREDFGLLKQYIIDFGITTLSMTYTALQALFTEYSYEDFDGHQILEIITAGEQLYISGGLREFLERNPNIHLYNYYGPSETHIVTASVFTLSDGYRVPVKASIGKPIANTQIHILDKCGRLVPPGLNGEIFISGWNLAKGYNNSAELTNSKFIPDLFKNDSLMYRTGDLGKWLPDGHIEYMGRNDDQIKIRGYRVELSEIRNVLLSNTQIKDAIVLFQKGSDKKSVLVMYLIAHESIDAVELNNNLRQQIPAYMIPAFYQQVDSFPFTTNGKIDISALPEPINFYADSELEADFVPPSTEIEKIICKSFEEILGVESPGIKSNFFKMGGHSLKAILLLSRLNRYFGANLTLSAIYQNPTIKGISLAIEKGEKAAIPDIRPVNSSSHYPASPGQELIMMFDKFHPGARTSYTLIFPIQVSLNLDLKALEKTMSFLINRHEVFRTRFAWENQGCFQVVEKNVDFQTIYKDISMLESQEDFLHDDISREYHNSFDLESAPLLRLTVYLLSDSLYKLLFSFQHIIFDAWSAEIFKNELIEAYLSFVKNEEPQLPALKIQYKDYAYWYKQLLSSGYFQVNLDYWLQKFKNLSGPVALPTDFDGVGKKDFLAGIVEGTIMANEVTLIQKSCLKLSVSTFSHLLSCITLVISEWTNSDDVYIGTPVAGRFHEALENQIGFYVNMLPLYFEIKNDITFAEWVTIVHKELAICIDNQTIPYALILEDLDKNSYTKSNSLFNIVVNMIDIDFNNDGVRERNNAVKEAFQVEPTAILNSTLKNDLTFNFYQSNSGECHFYITYAKELFREETILILKENFENLLSVVQDEPNFSLESLKNNADSWNNADAPDLDFNIDL